LGEPKDIVEMCLVEIIAVGPRTQHEFEQLLPGGENPDAGDPILDAVELSSRGHPDRARALLDGLVDWDARRIGAHAHLGVVALRWGRDRGSAGALSHRDADRRRVAVPDPGPCVGWLVQFADLPSGLLAAAPGAAHGSPSTRSRAVASSLISLAP
jgi:hypothetical protein